MRLSFFIFFLILFNRVIASVSNTLFLDNSYWVDIPGRRSDAKKLAPKAAKFLIRQRKITILQIFAYVIRRLTTNNKFITKYKFWKL